MRARSLAVVFALALATLGAAGCKDFHYYDIDVSFAGFNVGSDISTIQYCRVTVSGAESFQFDIMKNCPPAGADPHMGVFEYSSLADSGSLTFEVKVYNGLPIGPTCEFGAGSKVIPITSTITVNDTLTVNKSTAVPAGCPH
jgi:hypothetical protein